MTDLKTQTDLIKHSLMALKASGSDGFEGLLRLTLTDLTGISFRLASSGLQGGLDGDAAFPTDAVCFEAKRYDQNLGRTEVLVKIADLARRDNSADRLWILGATTEVGAQLADQIRHDGDADAISTLILDWIPAPLPLLAVAVVNAGAAAIAFIDDHADPKQDRELLEGAFEAIVSQPSYLDILNKIKSDLNSSKFAMSCAVRQNAAWRLRTFSNRNSAMERLGQALTVANPAGAPGVREQLRALVLSTISPTQCVVLIGEEGEGKSWLAAQICCDHPGMALFISAESFGQVEASGLTDFLIEQMIRQTGEVPTEELTGRWRHRLSAWEQTHPAHPFLVIVDGLNQRPHTRWDRMLDGLFTRLQAIGGILITTVRPHYWRQRVRPGVTCQVKEIRLQPWTPAERDAQLTHFGVAPDWLDVQTRETLRNPRLLGIVARILPPGTPDSWKGLTRDRLLFEHLRMTQAENFEPLTFDDLTRRISDHARQVLENVRNSSKISPPRFPRDTEAVMECRFFRTLEGPGTAYELRGEGLTLALGYAVVDQLWTAHHAGQDLFESVARLIDPIQAMDRTVEVMFDALMICALGDDRFDKSIFSALMDSFANLQNVDERRFNELTDFLAARPAAVFEALRVFCLERGRRINFDWFREAAFWIAQTPPGRVAADNSIREWLHCYNADPKDQTNRYRNQGEEEDYKRLKRNQDAVDAVLSKLSRPERDIFERMSPVTGETDHLFELALQLLAGRPLSEFAECFVALGLGLALDQGTHQTEKAFQHLTSFNRADRDLVRDAFRAAIAPLRLPETSRAGQWTVVRMLFATGDERDAEEANRIAETLRAERPPFPRLGMSWRDLAVANPSAELPEELADLAARFRSLDEGKMFLTMGQSAEDHEFRELLPLMCRYAPEVAVEKGSALLSGLLTREGMALRQLIFNADYLAPLMKPNLAVQIVDRFADPHLFDTLAENERDILRSRAFEFVVPHLIASEQLSALQSGRFGDAYTLDILPSFKSQTSASIEEALLVALEDKNVNSIFMTLSAAQYGETPLTSKLDVLIQQCFFVESSLVRAACFQIASSLKIASIRALHVESSWSMQEADESIYEAWYGARLLVDAVELGEIAIGDLLARIDRRAWFLVVQRLGKPVAQVLFDALLDQIEGGISQAKQISPPLVDLSLSRVRDLPYPHWSAAQTDRGRPRFEPEPSLQDLFGKGEDFDETQKTLHRSAAEFFRGLNGTALKELIREVSTDELRLLVEVNSDNLLKLIALLETATDLEFVWLQQIALAVASLISSTAPDRAIALLRRARRTEGFLTIAYGDGLTLEHAAVWSCVDSKAMREYWRERLLASSSNAALATEIQAAERFGAEAFIQDLIRDLSQSSSTLDQAYGLMAAGYSIQCAEHSVYIRSHAALKGLTGDAARQALRAMEQHAWAKSWVIAAWEASTAEEVFVNQTVAKTCMDARTPAGLPTETPWAVYLPLFQRQRKSALKQFDKERAKKLLGHEVPASLFLRKWQ